MSGYRAAGNVEPEAKTIARGGRRLIGRLALLALVVLGLNSEFNCLVAAMNEPLRAPAGAGCAYAGAHDRHVAPWGDDAGAGDLAHPWRTVQHAADHVSAGDIVWVHAGIYREWVAFRVSGTVQRPITFQACPGETVIFDGHGLEWRHGLDIGGEDHLRFQGFQVRDYIRQGVRGFGFVCWTGCRDIQLRRMEFSQVGTAVKFTGHDEDILLEGIYAYDYDQGGFDCGPAGPCSRLTLRRFIARGPGQGNDTAVDGFAVEMGSDIVVEDCFSSAHPGDGFDFKSDRTVLRRVMSLDQARNGIKLWGKNSRLENALSAGSGLEALVLAAGGSYTVINSLFANTRLYGYTAYIGDGEGATPVLLRNTIFANAVPENEGTLVYFSAGVTLRADHNLYYDPFREDCVIDAAFAGGCYAAEDWSGRWRAETGQGQGDRYAAPRFVNPLRDFHVLAGSTAIDAGNALDAPATDLDGRWRPQGAGVDIGPYEFPIGSRRWRLPLLLKFGA